MSGKNQQSPVFGIIEHVDFPELSISDVIAKIDTGAYSGALHCSKIELIEQNGASDILRFTPINDSAKQIELTTFKTVYVRSSNGHRVRRFLIDTPIVIQGEQYSIRIGLSDRSSMKTDALIGRRFLRSNDVLVDVRINQEEDEDGGSKI